MQGLDSPDGSAADAALRRLADQPDDLTCREQAARALARAGRHDEAVALLRDALIHLNAHDSGSLPCLCRRCLVASETAIELQGRRYVRDFVVAEHEPRPRVLFYWMPDDLLDQQRRVRRSVRIGLKNRPAWKVRRRSENG